MRGSFLASVYGMLLLAPNSFAVSAISASGAAYGMMQTSFSVVADNFRFNRRGLSLFGKMRRLCMLSISEYLAGMLSSMARAGWYLTAGLVAFSQLDVQHGSAISFSRIGSPRDSKSVAASAPLSRWPTTHDQSRYAQYACVRWE